ncbi:MAG: hypothetical protein AB7E66_04675 [Parvibaculaceae bacterium]
MISYLFDAVLLLALIATSVQVAIMYRQLRRLRAHDGEYRRILRETSAALDSIDGAVRDINAHGSQIILTLGERIEDAEALVARLEVGLEALSEPLARLEAASHRPVLAWSAPEPVRPTYQPETVRKPQPASESLSRRYFEPAPGARPQAYTAPLSQSQSPAAQVHAPTAAAPTLGDYLGRWKPSPAVTTRSVLRAERI